MRKLIEIIKNNIRHQDYERVTDLALTYKKLISGEDMDSLMRQFDMREDDTAFEQRKRITQHITKSVANNLMKVSYKVPRSNSIQKILEYIDDDQNKKKQEFNKLIENFYGDDSLDEYLNSRYITLNHTDPNSFIILHWNKFDNTKERAKPFPVEASSFDAIYFEYDNNKLELLVTKQDKTVVNDVVIDLEPVTDNKMTGYNSFSIYTMYDKDKAIRLTEVVGVLANEIKRRGFKKDRKFEFEGKTYVSIDGKGIYLVEEPEPYNLGFVPAKRVGFYRDIYTDNRTMLSAIDDAVPILMKMVKANSELDLTMALHAFPQKVQLVPRCSDPMCHHGKLPNGDICGSCTGKGLRSATSAQDIIEVEQPKDREELISVDEIIKYISPEVNLLKFQDEYVKSLTAQCKEAVFNSDIFSRQEVAETATGKNIDLQNVYDSLFPMARAYSNAWTFYIMAISKITETDKGLIYEYIFSKDFKMKTLYDLYQDLKLVADSKAESFVKGGIYDDIAGIIYAENPIELERYTTKKTFYPYTGKTDNEIMFIVAELSPFNYDRVLWENYGHIFDDIAQAQAKNGKDFYSMKRSNQEKLIEKEVKKITDQKREESIDANPSVGDD